MNIWAMEKDISIKHLLLMLTQHFSNQAFDIGIEDNNDKAIRLYKHGDKSLSVYIFTYGQAQECYGIHLEYPDLQETSLNNTLDIYDNIDYQTLCNLVQAHLDMPVNGTYKSDTIS